jgi:hypothetical protein
MLSVSDQKASLSNPEFDRVLAELREQGLKVTLHSALNETWYIKGEELFTGYIASVAELLELKAANKLNIRGIKSLG